MKALASRQPFFFASGAQLPKIEPADLPYVLMSLDLIIRALALMGRGIELLGRAADAASGWQAVPAEPVSLVECWVAGCDLVWGMTPGLNRFLR